MLTVRRGHVLLSRAGAGHRLWHVVRSRILAMEAHDAQTHAAATEVLGPVPLPLHEAVSAFKRRLVEDALARHGGNRSRAAVALGIERTSLLRIIRELGIEGLPPGQPGRPSSPSSHASVPRTRTETVEIPPSEPQK